MGYRGAWGSEERTLYETYKIIKLAVTNHGIKLKITPHINYIVKYLFGRYGREKEDIYQDLFEIFKNRNRHHKWDPSKSRYEVYVVYFVYHELKSLQRKLDKNIKIKKTIPLSQLEYDDTIDRSGMSTCPYERQGIEGLTNNISPEDDFNRMELMQIAENFFGHHDLEVLLGAKDRSDEARRLGIDYQCYCKRLNRRVQRFRSYLEDIGYTD